MLQQPATTPHGTALSGQRCYSLGLITLKASILKYERSLIEIYDICFDYFTLCLAKSTIMWLETDFYMTGFWQRNAQSSIETFQSNPERSQILLEGTQQKLVLDSPKHPAYPWSKPPLKYTTTSQSLLGVSFDSTHQIIDRNNSSKASLTNPKFQDEITCC